MPWWVPSPLREQAYFTDPDYLRRTGIELRGPIPVEQVIPTMGTADFQPGVDSAFVRSSGSGDLQDV